MYRHSPQFYDALHGFRDYAKEVAALRDVLAREAPDARRLLDVACGTGRHLELLRPHYEVEGLDVNPEMLDAARRRCPSVPLHEADMAEFSLGTHYDVITCMFSSIGCVKTRERLEKAAERMSYHLNPQGLCVVEPWYTPEQFWSGTLTVNHVDEPELKITWMYTSERRGTLSLLDHHYMVGRPQGIEVFRELHEIGLFTRDEYLAAFEKAGLEARYESGGPLGRGIYIARRPPST